MHFNKSNTSPQIFVTKIGIKYMLKQCIFKTRCGCTVHDLFFKKDVAMLSSSCGRLRFMRNFNDVVQH